jgi:hypothetical protein
VSLTDQIIRRPTARDIDFLVENIRDEDTAEINAMGGMTAREALDSTPNLDENAWVWEKNGKVMCIFGVNPIEELDRTGAIWLLGTKYFDDHHMVFAAACSSVFEELIKDYKMVFNYVYAENKKSIKWLEWLGFKVRDAQPIGINGANFHRFEMVNDNV